MKRKERGTVSKEEYAEAFYQTEYKEKWRGATMKAIVISAYCAGYEQARSED